MKLWHSRKEYKMMFLGKKLHVEYTILEALQFQPTHQTSVLKQYNHLSRLLWTTG